MGDFFNKKKWLEEGFILQVSRRRYILGRGPFFYSSRPCPPSLYHPDFFLTRQKPWVKAAVVKNFTKKELSDFLSENVKKTKKGFVEEACSSEGMDFADSDWNFKDFQGPSFLRYQELFCQAQQAIRRGAFQKLVPALAESFTLEGSTLAGIQKLFQASREFSHGFLYGFWQRDRGLLGFTPEILFSLQGDCFSTMALAGTGPCPGPSLLKDPKETKEHDMVVQNLEESSEGLFQWRARPTCEISFPPLKHLCTKMEGRLVRKFHFEKFCHKLHPTSALGGYPQKSAFRWLKRHFLQKDRGFFGAPFGYFHSSKQAFCLVALRALEWEGSRGRIFSGGGLIKESRLQKEWRELFLKRKQVKTFFGMH